MCDASQALVQTGWRTLPGPAVPPVAAPTSASVAVVLGLCLSSQRGVHEGGIAWAPSLRGPCSLPST